MLPQAAGQTQPELLQTARANLNEKQSSSEQLVRTSKYLLSCRTTHTFTIFATATVPVLSRKIKLEFELENRHVQQLYSKYGISHCWLAKTVDFEISGVMLTFCIRY
jgi:hypothetical protein